MKKIYLAFQIIALGVVVNAYARERECVRQGNVIRCREVRTEYIFERTDGKWCIAQTIGGLNYASCFYERKQDCVDQNPHRSSANQRCIKNPKFDDDDE